jgi:hypothetical protein
MVRGERVMVRGRKTAHGVRMARGEKTTERGEPQMNRDGKMHGERVKAHVWKKSEKKQARGGKTRVHGGKMDHDGMLRHDGRMCDGSCRGVPVRVNRGGSCGGSWGEIRSREGMVVKLPVSVNAHPCG